MLIKTQTVLMNVMLLGELATMLSIFIAFQDGLKHVIPVPLMRVNGITRDMVDDDDDDQDSLHKHTEIIVW